MTLEERIEQEKFKARVDRIKANKRIFHNNDEDEISACNRSAEEHEQLAECLEELKAIKEIDLSIPQHFTKEQSDWIKAYCIKRNIEFYNKALDDFVKFANTMPTVETEDGEIRPMRLEEMAEQLKEGREDENSN